MIQQKTQVPHRTSGTRGAGLPKERNHISPVFLLRMGKPTFRPFISQSHPRCEVWIAVRSQGNALFVPGRNSYLKVLRLDLPEYHQIEQVVLSFSNIVSDRKLSERLWAEKGRLRFIRRTISLMAVSNVKHKISPGQSIENAAVAFEMACHGLARD